MSVLLRSGDIKDFTALGQDGQAVCTVASQLRDSIKFRLGRQYADYLALPQRNEQGSIIDWYVPFESKRNDGNYSIVPWTSATDEEKAKALPELDAFKDRILTLGHKLVQPKENDKSVLKGDQLLFSRLLYIEGEPETEQLKAIRFPNEEYVYLVDERPVITFWGFVDKNQSPYADPYFCLRPPMPSYQEQILPVVATKPAVIATESVQKHKCFRFWWICLPLLFLLGWLLFCLLSKGYFPTVSFPTFSIPAEKEVRKPTEEVVKSTIVKDPSANITYANNEMSGTIVETPALQNLNAAEPLAETALPPSEEVENMALPMTEADLPNSEQIDYERVDAMSESHQVANNSSENSTINAESMPLPDLDTSRSNNQTETTPQPLQINSNALAQGNVNFLDGNWSAGAGIQDKASGKPLRLNYQFEDGKGTVTLKRGDGVKCTGAVNASLSSTGLNIRNSSTANCSDGSTYQLPNVVCKPTKSGVADCSGSYVSGQHFPMSMKSDSK